jgi:hypothetical protein
VALWEDRRSQLRVCCRHLDQKKVMRPEM